MIKDKVVFIEDEQDSIETFGRALRRIYRDSCEVEAIMPSHNISETLGEFISLPNVVAIFLDEKLSLSGIANFSGSDLAEAIREYDDKIPVYIITSYKSQVEPHNRNIEFVIDKNDFGYPNKREAIANRVLRHTSIFKEISNERTIRFDALLKKSLNQSLSHSEIEEYDRLNVLRTKPILSSEIPASSDLEGRLAKREELIRIINTKIEELRGKK